ncbi:MAG: hypothetical protein HQK97_11980 [Nitrospirae bacterium]|nr:hypothetical protein [Nitrospirota bacterium]
MSGRTRRPQLELAREFGLTEFPNPAGGCLLTDPIYSYRLSELLRHMPQPPVRDINLLKTGRHFRLSDSCKAIIGRNEAENTIIETHAADGDITMTVEGIGSPTTIVTGAADSEILMAAASLTARYADSKYEKTVTVSAFRVNQAGQSVPLPQITVPPAHDALLAALRIEETRATKQSTKPIRV